MQSPEILDHRIDDIEKNVVLVSDNIKSISNNLECLLEHSEKLNTRISCLEKELEDRKLKNYIFRLMLVLYPLVIATLLFINAVDHGKLLVVITDIENLLDGGQN